MNINKKILFGILLLSIVLATMVQWTAFGADRDFNVSNADVICDQPGTVYHVSGETDQHVITVTGGTETNPIKVDLNGVSIDMSHQKKSPLTVENGYAEIFV